MSRGFAAMLMALMVSAGCSRSPAPPEIQKFAATAAGAECPTAACLAELEEQDEVMRIVMNGRGPNQ